jgi:hypothetical protein
VNSENNEENYRSMSKNANARNNSTFNVITGNEKDDKAY